MEIDITDKLKTLDSELIQYLITIPNKNNTITINKKYFDVYKIIKRGKILSFSVKNKKYLSHVVYGLSYFGNKKILNDILSKTSKYVKEKYIDRKSIERFFEKNIKKYNLYYSESVWYSLCTNPNLSEAFFEKYKSLGNLNFEILCKNTNLSEAFFEKYISEENYVDWYSLCINTNLSEAFFEKYIKKGVIMYWWSLCQNTNLSEGFFERHLDKVNWDTLCKNTNISEAFFERYFDKINWDSLCQNTNISEKFFEKHIENVVWYYISGNFNISEAFFEKYLNEKVLFKLNLEKLFLKNILK